MKEVIFKGEIRYVCCQFNKVVAFQSLLEAMKTIVVHTTPFIRTKRDNDKEQ